MEVNGQLLVVDPIRFSVIDRFQSLPPTHAITSKAQAARPVHPPLSPHLSCCPWRSLACLCLLSLFNLQARSQNAREKRLQLIRPRLISLELPNRDSLLIQKQSEDENGEIEKMISGGV